MWRYFTSIPIFWRFFVFVFYHKWVLNFVESFFCICYHMVFVFQFVNMCITLIYLHILKNPWIPGINPIWSWCMIFLFFFIFYFFHSFFISWKLITLRGEGNGNPLQYSCLENLMGRRAWWAAVHGVTKSQTRLSNFTFTFHFHALEREMAMHSSVLAQRIPGTVEPGGLMSGGSQRVGHNWSDLAAAAAITLQYCSGFCYTLTWISHGFTCVLHPNPSSHLPHYPIPLGLPSVPALSTCLMHPTWVGDLFHLW